MAEVRMGGIQIRGFFTILPIWSMEVPMPWDTRPPHLFSRKLITAKPTIWAQQPATAAPPASPAMEMAWQMAALEMGSVSAMPTNTETTMPIQKGWSTVAMLMRVPTDLAARPMAGAHHMDSAQPRRMVTSGVTRRSTLVSLLTSLPTSAERMAIISTDRGPPAPPAWLEA